MSETLEVLIKLAERKVEAAQLALNQTREALKGCRDRMLELEREAAAAFADAAGQDDLMLLQAAGAFQERVRRDVEALRQVEAALLGQEQAQQSELQALYAGQKKYELLLEKQKLAQRKERAKKAQNALDEVAGRRR